MVLSYSFLLILLPPQTLDPCLISLYSQFESIDTNHDGMIDQREFEMWHKNNQYMKDINFYEIDMDNNSKISFKEWKEFLKRKKINSR
jgi:Ca2+-binding EF-hand superfamily protein